MKKIFLVFLMSLSLLGSVACETAKQPNSDNSPPMASEEVGGSNTSPEENPDGTVDLPMDEF